MRKKNKNDGKAGKKYMVPKDPVMLLSFMNLKLRDFYPNLEAFCEDMDEDMQAIVEKLASIDYHYDREKNQFV